MDDIEQLLNYYLAEYRLTNPEIIGVLELAKLNHYAVQAALYNATEDEGDHED